MAARRRVSVSLFVTDVWNARVSSPHLWNEWFAGVLVDLTNSTEVPGRCKRVINQIIY